jgi:WD40 repeat protein
VQLWNVNDPAHPVSLGPPLVNTKLFPSRYVNSVAFSRDGHTLATASADWNVRLWNVADPTNSVLSVVFSPDGHTLASSEGPTVRLWNVTDPAHPTPVGQPLTGHTDSVFSAVFSPDGRTLATGSADQTVRLWSLS